MSDNVDTLASDAAYLLTPILEYNLRIAADAGGWPDDIIKQLTVEYDNGNLSIGYPDNLTQQVQDLEYGKEGAPPKPVLRNFIYRTDSYVKEILANQTVDLLMEYEEVF